MGPLTYGRGDLTPETQQFEEEESNPVWAFAQLRRFGFGLMTVSHANLVGLVRIPRPSAHAQDATGERTDASETSRSPDHMATTQGAPDHTRIIDWPCCRFSGGDKLFEGPVKVRRRKPRQVGGTWNLGNRLGRISCVLAGKFDDLVDSTRVDNHSGSLFQICSLTSKQERGRSPPLVWASSSRAGIVRTPLRKSAPTGFPNRCGSPIRSSTSSIS